MAVVCLILQEAAEDLLVQEVSGRMQQRLNVSYSQQGRGALALGVGVGGCQCWSARRVRIDHMLLQGLQL